MPTQAEVHAAERVPCTFTQPWVHVTCAACGQEDHWPFGHLRQVHEWQARHEATCERARWPVSDWALPGLWELYGNKKQGQVVS